MTEITLVDKNNPKENSQPAAIKVSTVRPQQKRRRLLLWSFILCVLLPVAVVTLYYAFFATDRYRSTAGFSIRGIESNSGIDGLATLTGLASTGSTTADSYIVLKYLESRSLLEKLDRKLDLKAVYSYPEIDWISRMDADIAIEDFVDYWLQRITTEFDPSSGIIEFTVQSFSPEHALRIAEQTIQLTQNLVNKLSENARQDSLKFAQAEVRLQEQRLRSALEAIRQFRTIEQSVDPMATAALDIQLLADLEARLIDINARIAVQQETLDEGAPSLVSLKRQAEALDAQIAKRRAEISGKLGRDIDTSAITAQLSQFETLDVERRFAEQSYASALNSLEQARRDADRQQRYLAVHLQPQAAEISEYPKRLRNSLLAAFVLFASWSIGTLIAYSVRDHLT